MEKLNRSRGWATAAIALALAATSPQMVAQTIVAGEISGVITDPSGGVLAGTTVSAKSEAHGDTRTATTNQQGVYRISLLPPGTYTLSVTASGFQPAEVKAAVSLGQVTDVPIQVSLQRRSEAVTVTTEAPLLQNDNANSTTTFSTLQLESLPTPGSDLTAFAFLAPGSTLSTAGGYGNFSSFGLPATSNSFTINGSDAMDAYANLNNGGASNLMLGLNEIQEAAVVTNGYTGQYGRQAGAQVNYVTRSGSNAFHGNAAWFWNGSKLNANDFFNNSTDTARPHAVANQWAGSFGGPVIKNKLFFFVDQEGLRYILPGGGPVYIPTTGFATYVLNNLQATNPAAVPFYTTALNLYAGASGASRATNVTAAQDPALGCGDFALAGYGTKLPCARMFENTVNNLNTEWLLATRVDYNPSSTDRLYFRFWTDHGIQATGTDPINPAFNLNSSQPQYTGQTGYTKTFGASAVNQLLLSGFTYAAEFTTANLAATLATFPTTFAFNDGLYSNLGGNDFLVPQGRNLAQEQIVDDFAYTHGKHEFKAGVNYRHNEVGDYSYGPNSSGTLTFGSMPDFVNGALVNGSTYAQSFARIGAEKIRVFSMGVYGQDQWKITPSLTLTAALRVEAAGNPSCARDCFDGLTSTFQNLTHSASIPYNSAIQLGMANAFRSLGGIVPQPRAGFAYSPDSKTVIRGGAGFFVDQFQGGLWSRFFTNMPNVTSFTATSGIAAPGVPGSAFALVANSNAALQSGFANGATLAQLQASVPGFAVPNLYTQGDQFKVARYLEWNFEVQRELTSNLTLSENYVGNRGWDEINQNPFLNAYSLTGFGGLPATAPDPRFGEINQLESTGRSAYNGLVSSLRWRVGSTLTGSLNYVWSHALDDCSNNCLLQFNHLTSPSYRYQLSPAGVDTANYGNSDYDIRHSFNANYVWKIPAHFQNSALKAVLGNWTASGTVFAHSGYPFSVVNSGIRSSYINNATGIASVSVLADWAGGAAPGSCSSPDTPCLTASEFLSKTQQTNFGNLARNSFRGPGYFDTDFNLSKSIPVRERYHFLIGMNFFNILNHPNFDLPANNINAGNFGTIVSTVAPITSPYGSTLGGLSAVSGRIMQANVKFQF